MRGVGVFAALPQKQPLAWTGQQDSMPVITLGLCQLCHRSFTCIFYFRDSHKYINVMVSVVGHGSCQSALSSCSANCLKWGCLMLLTVSPPSHLINILGNKASLLSNHFIPPPPLHGGEGSSFPGLVPLYDRVHSQSVVGVKPGGVSVVICYQLD